MGRQVVTRTLRFQYLLPSRFATELKKTEGVSAVLPDDKQMRLVVQGEKAAVDILVQLAQLADVKPLRYQLSLTLLKVGPGGRRQVLEKKNQLLENKAAVVVTLGGGSCELKGMLHGSPGEIQLTFEAQALRAGASQRTVTESLQATRRIPFGKPTPIVRFSDPTTGPRRDKKPTPINLVLEALASEALGIPTR